MFLLRELQAAQVALCLSPASEPQSQHILFVVHPPTASAPSPGFVLVGGAQLPGVVLPLWSGAGSGGEWKTSAAATRWLMTPLLMQLKASRHGAVCWLRHELSPGETLPCDLWNKVVVRSGRSQSFSSSSLTLICSVFPPCVCVSFILSLFHVESFAVGRFNLKL